MSAANQSIPGFSARHFLSLVEEKGYIGTWGWLFGTERIQWSTGFYRLLGLSPESVEPDFRLFHELIHPEDARDFVPTDDLIRAGHAVDRQFRIIRPDGSLRWLWSRAELLYGRDGKPNRAIGIAVDISERMQALETVSTTVDRWRSFAANQDAFVWSADPSGQNIRPGVGTSSTVQAGQDGWFEMVHEDDRAAARSAWRDALASKRAFRGKYRRNVRDGIRSHLLFVATPVVDSHDMVREWLGINIPCGAELPVDSPAGSTITRSQLVAGRAMLDWSVADLAKRSGVSVSTIRRMEAGSIDLVKTKFRDRVARALQDAGVLLIWPGHGTPGVALQEPQPSSTGTAVPREA